MALITKIGTLNSSDNGSVTLESAIDLISRMTLAITFMYAIYTVQVRIALIGGAFSNGIITKIIGIIGEIIGLAIPIP